MHAVCYEQVYYERGLHWRMVVIVAGCALFVTSHGDVRFTFQIHRFGEVL